MKKLMVINKWRYSRRSQAKAMNEWEDSLKRHFEKTAACLMAKLSHQACGISANQAQA